MTRVKHAPVSRRRRRKFMKLAKGQFGARSRLYRTAKEAVYKGMAYATRDRRNRKREFRGLWIARITAACKARGISYSKFMGGLIKERVKINRKMLADLALRDKNAFGKLVELVKNRK